MGIFCQIQTGVDIKIVSSSTSTTLTQRSRMPLLRTLRLTKGTCPCFGHCKTIVINVRFRDISRKSQFQDMSMAPLATCELESMQSISSLSSYDLFRHSWKATKKTTTTAQVDTLPFMFCRHAHQHTHIGCAPGPLYTVCNHANPTSRKNYTTSYVGHDTLCF